MTNVSNRLCRAAGLALCVLLIASKAAAQICINVDLRFTGHEPAPLAIQSMQHEASAIWQRYGVQIQWPRSRSEMQCPLVHGSFDVLVERQSSPARSTPPLVVLGSTHVVPAGIDHVGILVDYSRTENLLESMSETQLLGLLGRPEIGPVDIGRALGRVLAHEIGHVVLGAPSHQAWGLMRRAFSPQELVARHRVTYTLSKKEVERLGLRERELSKYQAPGLPWSWNFQGGREVSGYQQYPFIHWSTMK